MTQTTRPVVNTAVNNPTFKHFNNPKERLSVFQAIRYKNADIDFGIILGERKGRWELKSYRQPTWARNLTTGEYISECSPHKKNLTVYISQNDIKVNDEILIFKDNKYSKILITKKVKKTFGCKLLETWMNVTRTNHFPKGSTQLTIAKA